VAAEWPKLRPGGGQGQPGGAKPGQNGKPPAGGQAGPGGNRGVFRMSEADRQKFMDLMKKRNDAIMKVLKAAGFVQKAY
jgi:hypothetical protein